MFTGLIEYTGRVSRIEEGGMWRLGIFAPEVAAEASAGESVSVNGVCLTVESVADGEDAGAGEVVFGAMPETLRRTALGELSEGGAVNLELAMAVGERLGGHIVQGHVDGVGRVLGRYPEGDAEIWEFSAPRSVLRYTVEKGSICVDGISLTVVAVEDSDDGGSFTVSVLPQTRDATNLASLSAGVGVNLEADVIGKHVERLLGPHLARERP